MVYIYIGTSTLLGVGWDSGASNFKGADAFSKSYANCCIIGSRTVAVSLPKIYNQLQLRPFLSVKQTHKLSNYRYCPFKCILNRLTTNSFSST